MGKTSAKKYNKYPRDALEKAIKAVREEKTCSEVARDFGVPRKTLADHVSGMCSLDRRAETGSNIPADIDNAIVDEVIKAVKSGFPIIKSDNTNMQVFPDLSKAVAEKGERSVYSRCCLSNESSATFLTINAAGQAMLPLCVMKGKNATSTTKHCNTR